MKRYENTLKFEAGDRLVARRYGDDAVTLIGLSARCEARQQGRVVFPLEHLDELETAVALLRQQRDEAAPRPRPAERLAG